MADFKLPVSKIPERFMVSSQSCLSSAYHWVWRIRWVSIRGLTAEVGVGAVWGCGWACTSCCTTRGVPWMNHPQGHGQWGSGWFRPINTEEEEPAGTRRRQDLQERMRDVRGLGEAPGRLQKPLRLFENEAPLIRLQKSSLERRMSTVLQSYQKNYAKKIVLDSSFDYSKN